MAKLLAVLVCACALTSAYAGRSLSMAERRSYREAIARIDPRAAYAPDDTAALESYFRLSLNDEMLGDQLARMARETESAAKLGAIERALGNDPFLVKECLARPALTDRLGRERYAYDAALHAKERDEAEALRRSLVHGELEATAEHPLRAVFRGPAAGSDDRGSVSPVREDRDGFSVFVVLDKTAEGAAVARYRVPKIPFDAWWASARKGVPNTELVAVARDGGMLPEPASVTACSGASAAQSAELAVLTFVDPAQVTTGGTLTYTVVFKNNGPDTAVDAEMLFVPADGTTFQSLTLTETGGWECTAPPPGRKGKISCTKKCAAPFVDAVFTIVESVDACAGIAPALTMTTVSSSTGDPFPPNNLAPTQAAVDDPGTCDDGNACTTGDHCVAVADFTENFDADTHFPPRLPPGWTATMITGDEGAQPWRATTSGWDTRPNSVFSPNYTVISDSVLDSPEIPIHQPNARLSFRTFYSLEDQNDGGVLEIRIGAGAFDDIVLAGGEFLEGGYTNTIRSGFGNPIAGREAWTASSNQWITSTVILPPQAAGRTIVLRWRLATDRNLGSIGQWVDSITISDHEACAPGPPASCDDHDACTADTCDPALGCRNTPISCDDGVACTDDVCSPLTGCAHIAAGCDDGNPCTDDTCSDAGCIHTNNTAPCNDGNACTLTDVCTGGVCAGGNAIVCHDDNACTADACDPVLRCVAMSADFDGTAFSAGRVDGRDLAVLADAWNSCPGSPRYAAEVNLDRQGPCIDLEDFHLFMGTFGRTCP